MDIVVAGIIILLISIVITFILFARSQAKEKKRVNHLAAFAEENGFTYKKGLDNSAGEYYPELSMEKIEHVLIRKVGTQYLLLADCLRETENAYEPCSLALVQDESLFVPHFALTLEQRNSFIPSLISKALVGTTMNEIMDATDIDFDDDPLFSKVYYLCSGFKEHLVRTFFFPKFRDYLLEHGKGFDVFKGCADSFCVITRKRVPLESYPKFFALIMNLHKACTKGAGLMKKEHNEVRNEIENIEDASDIQKWLEQEMEGIDREKGEMFRDVANRIKYAVGGIAIFVFLIMMTGLIGGLLSENDIWFYISILPFGLFFLLLAYFNRRWLWTWGLLIAGMGLGFYYDGLKALAGFEDVFETETVMYNGAILELEYRKGIMDYLSRYSKGTPYVIFRYITPEHEKEFVEKARTAFIAERKKQDSSMIPFDYGSFYDKKMSLQHKVYFNPGLFTEYSESAECRIPHSKVIEYTSNTRKYRLLRVLYSPELDKAIINMSKEQYMEMGPGKGDWIFIVSGLFLVIIGGVCWFVVSPGTAKGEWETLQKYLKIKNTDD